MNSTKTMTEAALLAATSGARKARAAWGWLSALTLDDEPVVKYLARGPVFWLAFAGLMVVFDGVGRTFWALVFVAIILTLTFIVLYDAYRRAADAQPPEEAPGLVPGPVPSDPPV